MLLLGMAGVTTSIACAVTFVTGRMSEMGKVLGFVVLAIGVPLGTTVWTVAGSAGATKANAVSIGIVAGALVVILGNMAIRRLIKKAKIQRPS